MKWALLLFVIGSGSGYIEFETEELCVKALARIASAHRDGAPDQQVFGACVQVREAEILGEG